jgi:esterase/lipase superfamily enzyme
VAQVTDRLRPEVVKSLNTKYKLKLDLRQPWHASLKVACDLYQQAQDTGKNILFFVHGYNNDVKDVVKAAEEIEKRYNLIVVPFTWPANGGGVISGTASYLSDKADARLSSAALNRVVGKIKAYHEMLTRATREDLMEQARARHPNNPQAARELFTTLQRKACGVRLSLLCHSMGNYVLKHTLTSSDRVTDQLVFDNICLVAADTNNEDHREWVGQLDVRNRCYVVINENDAALAASRVKPGEKQLARLGHYLRKLNSPNARYIDVTNVDHVDTDHTYFKGTAVQRNAKLNNLFELMFNGEQVEELTSYYLDTNTYRLS